ncbi:putative Zn(2)-C6 fungal-type domain-containing protein [Seiridium unicorne]|uniref:Zn(2)-C6 fungal-type domain-containing protein n=1 Tax=Seiridium unicorne TaxID=138068 RepID=A0ABR2VAQ2_9PEZI
MGPTSSVSSFSPGAIHDADSHEEPSSSATSVGYLGSTSFKPVFEETQLTLSLLGAIESSSDDQDQQEATILGTRSTAIQELCLSVLRKVPVPADGFKSFRTSVSPREVWQNRAAAFFLRGLYTTWGNYLTADRSDASLEKMAQVLCSNTHQQVSDDIVEPDRWLEQFTGPHLRWETLGLLFYFWRASNDFTPQAREPMGLCIRICREFTVYPTIWLQYLYDRRSALDSKYSGDASLSVWGYHFETMAMLTFQGLHADGSDVDYEPTLSSELRRRIFWTLFSTDKMLVSFTGRPPLLTRHHVSTPIPLDLPEDCLFADKDTLRHAVATSLDSEGWNTTGGLYCSTIIRARAMLSMIKDEILEIALGPGASKTAPEYVVNLRTRTTAIYNTFPQSISLPMSELKLSTVDPKVSFSRLLVRLEYSQNLFFIDRMLIKLGCSHGDLVGVSLEMVMLTVRLWTQSDHYSEARKGFEWIAMGYGAAAGGVLCMELLSPTIQEIHPPPSQPTRSSIIQNLSLLIGFLDWIKPSAPNGHLCHKAKTTIQQVLDYVLNADDHTELTPGDFCEDFSTTYNFQINPWTSFDWLSAKFQ